MPLYICIIKVTYKKNVAMFPLVISSVINIISSLLQIQIVWPSFIVGMLLNYWCIGGSYFKSVPEMGVLITMAIIGSHIDFSSLRKYYVSTFFIILSTIVSTIISTAILYELFAIDITYAAIIAAVLCLSSTIICQSVLYEHSVLSTDYGQLSIIGTIVQDIIGIIILLYVHAVMSKSCDYTIAIAIYVFMLLVMVVSCKLEITFEDCDNIMYNKIFVSICLFSYILGEYLDSFNVAKEFTFFAIGYVFRNVINDFYYLLNSIQSIAVAALFMFAGFHINVIMAVYNFRIIVEILLLIQFVKFILLYIFLLMTRSEAEVVIKTSLLLSVFTELTFFVVFLVDISNRVRDIIIIATMLSMVVSSALFRVISEFFTATRRKTIGIAKYAARIYINNLTDYILLIGINKRSLLIMNAVAENFTSAIIIDKQLDKVLASNNSNCFFMDARIKETYDILNLGIIKCIVVCTTDINDTIAICTTIRKINKEIIIYALCERVDLDRVVVLGDIKPIIITSATNT